MINNDLIGSFILGGIALLILVTLSLQLTSKSQSTVLSEIAQTEVAEFGKVIEHDINKLGYKVGGSNKILTANSTAFSFLGDKNNDGSIDNVSYYTQNSGGRMRIYRHTSLDQGAPAGFEVTSFTIQYFDSLGNATSNIADIKSMLLKIEVNYTYNMIENSDQIGVVWRKRFFPKNL